MTGEHGEAVTSNRDTLAAAAHDHWHGPRRCGRTCVLMARCERQANILLPTVEAMLAQARAEVVAAVEAGLRTLRKAQSTTSDLAAGGDLWAAGYSGGMRDALSQVERSLRSAVSGTDHETAQVERGNLGADERCRRCGGANVIWSAPSPLWNLVMRDNDIDGDPLYHDLVCLPCFVVLAEEAGVKARWRLTVDPEPPGLIKTTPSGRVWDADRWLWIDPLAAVSGTDHDTTLDTVRAEALRDAADVMSSRLDEFPTQGRHTRARWAEQWLRDRADRIAPDDTPDPRGDDAA